MSSLTPPPSSPSSFNPAPPPIPDPSKQSDATGGIIPYKNPHALAAYYLGVFSVIPILGFLCACVALPLGFSGLKKKKANPVIRGTVHAWVGIIIGSISILGHVLMILLPALSFAAKSR